MCYLLNDIPSLFGGTQLSCILPVKKKSTPLPVARWWYISVFVIISCITGMPAFSQMKDINYQPVRTPENVSVNYTVPKGALAPDEQITAMFSKEPTDEEIFRVHFFEEPLIPTSGKYSAEENKALMYALVAFSQRSNPEDFSSIASFLKMYQKSRWRGAILTNMGLVYRRYGYFHKAIDAFNVAWNIMKKAEEPKVNLLANRALAELICLYSWLSDVKKIEALHKEIKDRVIRGPQLERILKSYQTVEKIRTKPEETFKCGIKALNQILHADERIKTPPAFLFNEKAPLTGFSLTQLQKLSDTLGLNYQMAFRDSGAEIIPKAVVHWKLNHYSALLQIVNGWYRFEDPTVGTKYGQQFWLTKAAFEEEASGYFLVPKGPLPKGWRVVSEAEGSKIFGKCDNETTSPSNTALTPFDEQSGCSGSASPMAQANVHLAAVSLHIQDEPVFHTPPRGLPVLWDIHYTQRDTWQPSNFTYSNFGHQWTFSYLSYVIDNPTNETADVELYVQGGGVLRFKEYNTNTKSFIPEIQTKDVLVRTCDFPTGCYELRYIDGSKDIYSRPDGNTGPGRKVFLTYKITPVGDTLSILYDNSLRIIGVEDALGQVDVLSYEDPNDIYRITKITEPFGRAARFGYDNLGRLNKITDVIGIVSQFQYDQGNFITQMTTPYGITKFINEVGTQGDRAIEIQYPLSARERIEFKSFAPGVAASESATKVPSGGMNVNNMMLDLRNTFYWNKKAMLDGAGDYTKAVIYHWLSPSGVENVVTPMLESIKKPLENRIWYNYQGQGYYSSSAVQGMSNKPSVIGRVISVGNDTVRQYTRFGYNALGMDTISIDPLGRTISKKYDTTLINLLEVRQTANGANELLAKYTYDSKFKYLPKTATDAAGQTTTFTYTSKGQLQTVINAKQEKTTFYYKTNGYLDSIVGPVKGAKVGYTYDGFGRVRTVTDPEGYKVTTDFDNLNRPTVVTYPDSTFEQTVYNRLDAVATRDRIGRWSHYIYDSLDRMNVVTDPLGRITQFIWCACGNLTEIADPLKHITTFNYDIQSRITSKIYDDNTTFTYQYDSTTSRISAVTDAKGQTTKYSYYIDDNLKQIDYTNALVATPSVSFSYDGSYNRLDTMKDGSGTTAYFYYPVASSPTLGAGLLQKIDGPLANDNIIYTYDSLGRVKSRSINSVAASMVYDALGRVFSTTNALGTFTNSFVNTTNQLSAITLPNGTTTAFTYFNNAGDQRLKEIWNKKGTTTISKFDYEFNPIGNITKWTQQAGSATPNYYELGYDLSDQLTAVTQKNSSTNAILKRYAYQYDKAGNRTSEQVDNAVTSAIYNTLNQMTAQQDGGPMRFKGSVNEFASVLVKNNTNADSARATVDSLTNAFEAFVKMTPGTTNNVFIIATDSSGNNNRNVDTFNIPVGHGASNTLSFDNNGNTTAATNPAVTYSWDAVNRLVKIVKGGNTYEFIYDGLDRRVAEKVNGSITKRWLWCGTELCEERNAAGGMVTKRFFTQGEQINGTNYYFTRDHLGSIREITDAGGNIVSRYDYDPYGRRTKLSGTINSDFGFTGHYFDSASGLHLTLYRAYDANFGRWLSRDPIGENGGTSLYVYCKNNTIKYVDPDGQFVWIIAGGLLGSAINVGVTYFANGGNVTASQIAAAAASGFISGSLGAAAGPLGGTIARGLGFVSNGIASSIASGTISAGASGLGQAVANEIDPWHKTNPLDAALWGGMGGGLAKYFFPTRNLNTWSQASYFGPKTFGGLFGSSNAWLNNGSFLTSSGLGAASIIPPLDPLQYFGSFNNLGIFSWIYRMGKLPSTCKTNQ
jgi:RHS repeat-associated protein